MSLNKHNLVFMASHFVENSEENVITKDLALSETIIGMKIFEAPIFAFGAADDEYYELLKGSSAIGNHFLLPKQWLPQSKTVISFFLPFTEAVKRETEVIGYGLLKNGYMGELKVRFFKIYCVNI